MLTDLESTTGGRGGKRPGAGRPRQDGKRSSKTPIEKPDFEVKTPEELLEDGPPPASDLVPPDESMADAGAISFVVPTNPGALYAGAKARKEAALAAKAELEFRIKSGQYLPREAVRSALATSFQSIAQSLRSIPDNLERKMGVSSEVAEAVGVAIDEAMGDLAYSMEQLHTENLDAPKD